MKKLYFTVTNDLSYDQRMHRICTTLASAGFEVILIGRKLSESLPLQQRPFGQKRLSCFFRKGFLFYAEYNIRLFFFLLFKPMDGICAIDLDTILPCLLVSKIKKVHRVYDAHEYFTELKEVHTRPFVRKIWTMVEKLCVPRFRFGYTVSEGLATAFNNRYHRHYIVIRNLPVLKEFPPVQKQEYLLYQGAVNEGRCFEFLVPAMKHIGCRLVVCGDGNFMEQLEDLIRANGVEEKVELKGMIPPDDLLAYTRQAKLGMSLAEKEGLNQYLALPNKFFDYMHAGLPQITMDFPEYRRINAECKVAVLVQDLEPLTLARTINETLVNEALLKELSKNCETARLAYCWQEEEKKLVNYYRQIFSID